MRKFNIEIYYCKYIVRLFYNVYTDDIEEFETIVTNYIDAKAKFSHYLFDFSEDMEVLKVIKAVDNNYYIIRDNKIYALLEMSKQLDNVCYRR